MNINFGQLQTQVSAYASQYYQTHHWGNIACGLIAVEAGIRGLYNLAKVIEIIAVNHLFSNNHKESNFHQYQWDQHPLRQNILEDKTIRQHSVLAGQHLINAAWFGFCAYNPIAGAIYPVAAMMVDILHESENEAIKRYNTAFWMHVPRYMMAGATRQISHNFYINESLALVGLGALAMYGSCYALNVNISNLTNFKWLPLKITIS